MSDERRYKRLFAEYNTLIGILNGTVETVDFVLPDDARVVHVGDDPRRHGLSIIVESASYDPVPDGEEVPPVHSMAMRLRKKEALH